MTKTKSTKRALLMSALALLSCVSMLVGSTFAWFTDSVTSSRNKIVAGNLDIVLEYKTPDSTDWEEVTSDTVLFNEDSLWEPGHTEVVALRIRNAGTLALKYDLVTTVYEEVAGTNVDGDSFKLSDYLEVYASVAQNDDVVGQILTDLILGSRDKALGSGTRVDKAAFNTSLAVDNDLVFGEAHIMCLAITMPTTVGNEANYKTDTVAPYISFGVSLLATQATVESDSFDNQYDANAWLKEADYSWYDPSATTHKIDTAAQLAGFSAIVNGTATSPVTTFSADQAQTIKDNFKGETVVLSGDIDLNSTPWTPIGIGDGFKGTFDGKGHTISNLVIVGNNNQVGLFANTYDGEIKNLTVHNALVSGRSNVGVVAGNPYTSKYTNITVSGHVEVNGKFYVGGVGGKNAYANWTDITVNVDESSYVKADSIENGSSYRTYVGGVVGFNGEGGHTFKNINSNIDVIGNICDIGGVFGIAHYNNKFENITCSGDVTGTVFDPKYPEDADEIGGIAGVWHNANDTTVTFTNCKYTGKLTAADPSVDVSDNIITGKPYGNGSGKLIIDGATTTVTTNLSSLEKAIKEGASVVDAQGANLGDFYYDAKFTDGVTVKNAKFTYFYGGNVEGTVTFENCEFVSDHSYCANFDSGNGNIIFNNCLFDGWSSFGTAITGVEMNNCTFQKTYNYGVLRFYQNAEINNCTFADNFEGIDTNETGTEVHFNNCTGVEGKIFNNGDKVGKWFVDGVDISNTVTSW